MPKSPVCAVRWWSPKKENSPKQRWGKAKVSWSIFSRMCLCASIPTKTVFSLVELTFDLQIKLAISWANSARNSDHEPFLKLWLGFQLKHYAVCGEKQTKNRSKLWLWTISQTLRSLFFKHYWSLLLDLIAEQTLQEFFDHEPFLKFGLGTQLKH